jgi:hypothetical protein
VGDKTMAEYRAYVVGDDGRIMRAFDFESADDDAAKAEAKKLVDDHDVELWQRARKIGTFDHKPKTQR